MRLPRLAPEVVSETPVPRPAALGDTERRILVVDDNHDAARALALLLKLSGHEVHTAPDGPSGLDAVAEFQPDVVLLDIGMPGMDGYEVARHIRQSPSLRDVCLVALTGWGQEEDVRFAHASGFDHHLLKPVDLNRLMDTLRLVPRRG